MSYGSHERDEMLAVLDHAISLLRSGETDVEVFGVNADGTPDDVVIIMVRGEDYHKVVDALDLGDTNPPGEYHSHDFGSPENN